MKCSICSKLIFSQINCIFCNTIFCSNSCKEFHIRSIHSKYFLTPKIKIYEKPKIERIEKNNLAQSFSLVSPYITKGYISNKIKYEPIYDLKNFTPILENESIKIIGIGSYGKVYLYRNNIDCKLYAIKHINKKFLYKSIHTVKRIYDEINIQSKIYHKNIVTLLNVKENDESIYLIMEYANWGSLYNYIRRKKYLNEEESFKYFSQIINAVYFLHKNDLLHRDIKPENILLFEHGVCKLCDFGCCVELNGKQRSTFCGTAEYMSPEVVNKMEYSTEIDIWSLGILLYEMTHGYSPFRPNKEKYNTKEVIDTIKLHDLKFNINISKECKDLICHLLDKNAKNRYKIEDIFTSDFIKKYEKKDLYFLNEKFNADESSNPKINYIFRNSDRYNDKLKYKYNTEKKENINNQLLLSSIYENDSIPKKVPFKDINNFNFHSSNVKNKFNNNNIIFNNVINRHKKNKYNVESQDSIDRSQDKNFEFFNSYDKALAKEISDSNNAIENKKRVKVTKLSPKSFDSDDYQNKIGFISNVKKINNGFNFSNNFSFLNISYVKDKEKSNIHKEIKPNSRDIKQKTIKNSEINVHSYLDINNSTHNKESKIKSIPESSSQIFSKTLNKDISNNKNNFFNEKKKEKPKNEEIINIKKNYYTKQKIDKEFSFPKDNTKKSDNMNNNSLNFKNCINTKIKIPRRKILSSLQMKDMNIAKNKELINNNISSLNSIHNMKLDNIPISKILNEMEPIQDINNRTCRDVSEKRYISCLKDNSINTQINKNYIFNPNISITLPKFSYSNQRLINNKRNVKIKELKEDFKERNDSSNEIVKSQSIKNFKFINNIKQKSINNTLNVKSLIPDEKNNLKLREKNDLSKSLTHRNYNYKSKIKKNNNLENTSRSINKDKIKNSSIPRFKTFRKNA